MKKVLLFVFIALCPVLMFAQDTGKFGIKFSGFVKSDFIFDSRQSVAVREGHFHLYPLNELSDADGVDINAQPNFNILSIQTRLKGTITYSSESEPSSDAKPKLQNTINNNNSFFILTPIFKC